MAVSDKSRETQISAVEVIDAKELAERWKLPYSWIRNRSRDTSNRIPHVKLGRYVRYEWGSQALAEWWARQRR